ncbi:hypothetical protein [Rhodovulum adriaticum]|uniref:Uncharacterized protein n=1 Tax=Rhodovulum adriaticum TaxID=35804 RepID=A0A4R2NYL2_RHOAD|nr:hypothetical protein [Rhodovulum adriaticum]MBK1634131.1 hypothetical protein [Rhodovulum adriaticum]TCP27320.1 hypothetical protein EV656_101225 [Rhodovulum adriaticum]
MTHRELSRRLIAIARHEGDPTNPIATARRRGWLDAQGQPTRNGRELVAAMLGQRGTRPSLRVVG